MSNEVKYTASRVDGPNDSLIWAAGIDCTRGARTWYHKIQVHEDSKEKAIKLRDKVLEGLQK